MSQVEPTKATFSRDEIEKRIKESIAGDEVSNVNNTDDILESIDERLCGNKTSVLVSIDERLCETNDLLWRLVDKPQQPTEDDYGKPLMTQEDVNSYMESVKDYYGDMDGSDFDKYAFVDGKPVTLDKDQRHMIYVALGSRVSTMRNQMGYSKYHSHSTTEKREKDTGLQKQIDKHEKLIKKLKNS